MDASMVTAHLFKIQIRSSDSRCQPSVVDIFVKIAQKDNVVIAHLPDRQLGDELFEEDCPWGTGIAKCLEVPCLLVLHGGTR